MRDLPDRRVPQPERDPEWFRPVFVLAPARSNSSVVASMIGMHPQLYGFPELSLWRGEKVRDLITDRPGSRGLRAQARTAGLARAIAEVFTGRQDLESVTWARQWLAERHDWDVACVFDQLQGRVAPLVALEKSPENSNREDYLSRLDHAYPHARYLHVTRHPVSTVRSMHQARKAMNLWDLPDELYHLHLLGTWLFHHGRIKTFTESLPPSRWMRVRSEDVLNAPEETLPRICRWLGLDCREGAIEAMRHPEKSPYSRLGPPNALGGNDPGFLESPSPRRVSAPASLELPPDWMVDPWTHVSVVEMASSLGYRHELLNERHP
ncbi:MAG: sulfotransferase [Acidimicrobiales bacterium]|nr:sulfotransferase [Acidimicrobiales bacterium]